MNIQDEIKLSEQGIRHLKSEIPQFRELTKRCQGILTKFKIDLMKETNNLKALRARAKRVRASEHKRPPVAQLAPSTRTNTRITQTKGNYAS